MKMHFKMLLCLRADVIGKKMRNEPRGENEIDKNWEGKKKSGKHLWELMQTSMFLKIPLITVIKSNVMQ